MLRCIGTCYHSTESSKHRHIKNDLHMSSCHALTHSSISELQKQKQYDKIVTTGLHPTLFPRIRTPFAPMPPHPTPTKVQLVACFYFSFCFYSCFCISMLRWSRRRRTTLVGKLNSECPVFLKGLTIASSLRTLLA